MFLFWGVTLTICDHLVQLGAKNAVQGLLRQGSRGSPAHLRRGHH